MEKQGSRPAAAKSPRGHLRCFKTWNDLDISLQNSWPVQNPGNNLVLSTFTFIIPSQCRREQSGPAAFSLNVEPFVCFGLRPSTERLWRPLFPTALLQTVSNLHAEHISETMKSPDMSDKTGI